MARCAHHSPGSDRSTTNRIRWAWQHWKEGLIKNSTDNDPPGEELPFPTWPEPPHSHTGTPGNWCHQQVGIHHNKHQAGRNVCLLQARESPSQKGAALRKTICPHGPESPFPDLEIPSREGATAKGISPQQAV